MITKVKTFCGCNMDYNDAVKSATKQFNEFLEENNVKILFVNSVSHVSQTIYAYYTISIVYEV